MKRRHTLTGKLILLFVATAVLIALIMRIGFRYSIQDELRSLAEPHLLEYVAHLRKEIGTPPDPVSAKALSRRLSMDIYVSGPDGRWSTGGALPDLSRQRFHRQRIGGQLVEVGHDRARVWVRLKEGPYTLLLVSRSAGDMSRLPWVLVISILLVLAVIAIAYHLVRRLFSPIDTLRAGVMRFGTGDLDHRIRIDRKDELGELAQSINTMADEIQQMLDAKRQLLLAISHELRSPLTRGRVNAELLEAGRQKELIVQDLQEMEGLLAELLEGERLDGRHAKLALSAVSPAALIREVIRQHFGDDRLTVEIEDEEAYLSLDAVRIRLMIKNLLENALRHTPEGAESPELTSRIEAGAWHLSVQDHGEGVSREHLAHLAEPFYRVDRARQRETGGYGLGLYLCKAIAAAHGGTLDISSRMGEGTQVSVCIPLSG